jgi:hypothetical protein
MSRREKGLAVGLEPAEFIIGMLSLFAVSSDGTQQRNRKSLGTQQPLDAQRAQRDRRHDRHDHHDD